MKNEKMVLVDSDLEMVAGGVDWVCTIDGKNITFSHTVVGADGKPEVIEQAFCGDYAAMMARDFMSKNPHDTYKTPEGKPFSL